MKTLTTEQFNALPEEKKRYWEEIRRPIDSYIGTRRTTTYVTVYTQLTIAVEDIDDLLITACKYGYEYRANTQFPELSFEENCKNNFLQSIQHDEND